MSCLQEHLPADERVRLAALPHIAGLYPEADARCEALQTREAEIQTELGKLQIEQARVAEQLARARIERSDLAQSMLRQLAPTSQGHDSGADIAAYLTAQHPRAASSFLQAIQE